MMKILYEIEYMETDCFLFLDAPTVLLSIEPRSVLEGERVTFTCQATANPPIMGYR